MEKIFKAYSKGYKSVDSDSIFSFMGRKEVGMTKSIAALLYHDDEFLKVFLELIGFKEDIGNSIISIFAEQQSEDNVVHERKKRRDITIKIKSKSNGSYTLIVVEAKNPTLAINKRIDIINQLNEYFDSQYYSDVKDARLKFGVTLTNEEIKYKIQSLKFNKFCSLTWEKLAISLENRIFKNNITNSFLSELKQANFMKTYEVEVFCPPAGTSYNLIQKLKIYCCPFDRKLQSAIYLMPRIGVNDYSHLLDAPNQVQNRGKGFCLELYKITESFIVDSNSIEAIEDEIIRSKVIEWLNGRTETLKVFILSEPMIFAEPKFTMARNPRGNIYYELLQIWGNTLPKKE